MMETLKLLWQNCPGEVTVYGAIALASTVLLAVILAAAMLPTEPDKMTEVWHDDA